MWHCARWVILLLAFALTTVARAGELDSLEEFNRYVSERLKKLDKEVREFRQNDGSAGRRIADLEGQLRKANTKVARLEAKMLTMGLRIEELRRELDRLAATPRVASRATPLPGTAPGAEAVKPEPPEPKGPVATVISKRRQVSGNDLTITGTVQNISKEPLTFIVIKATFLDRKSKPVYTTSGYTNPRIIPPGGKATFKILARATLRDHRYTLSIRTE